VHIKDWLESGIAVMAAYTIFDTALVGSGIVAVGTCTVALYTVPLPKAIGGSFIEFGSSEVDHEKDEEGCWIHDKGRTRRLGMGRVVKMFV